MEADTIPHFSTDSILTSGDIQDAPSLSQPEQSSVVTTANVVSLNDNLTITKSIKVAANVEIPIHIPVAQPIQRQPPRGKRRTQNVTSKQKIQSKDTLRKLIPGNLPAVFIKTSKGVSDSQNMMETVINDPTIQEMLKQNPGHTLTLVRLPDGQIPPIQLEGLSSSETVMLSTCNQPVEVDLATQETPSPARGKPGRKKKRKKMEESEEDGEVEEEVTPKVTRSGRVIKPPSYQGKYYVGLGGKSFKTSEEEESTGKESASEVNQNGLSSGDSKHVKRGPGRPRKYPRLDSEASPELFKDPVPRYQITRLAKQVSSWDFMLMRAYSQSQRQSGKTFYEELLKEFKAMLVNMRRLSSGVLQEIPESLTLTDDENGAINLNEILSASLGLNTGLYKAQWPSKEVITNRVINWIGADASVFSEKKEGPDNLVPVTLDALTQEQEETAESLLQTVSNITAVQEELSMVESTLTTQEGLQVEPTVPLLTTQVQGALVPQGSVIMEMENGTFMAQTPDGATMEIQAPESMTLETLSELLDQATGAYDMAPQTTTEDTGVTSSEGLQEKDVISTDDGVLKDPEILPTIPKTMIGNLQVKRSIELSKSSKPATILLQT